MVDDDRPPPGSDDAGLAAQTRRTTAGLASTSLLLALAGPLSGCAPTSDTAPTSPPNAQAPDREPPPDEEPPTRAAGDEGSPPKPDPADDTPVEGARPATWPEPLPWVLSPYPGGTEVVVSVAGDRHLRTVLGMAPVTEIASPWRDGLRAQGFVETAPCELDEATAQFSCTYRSAERLALLAIGPRTLDPKSETISVSLHLLPPGHRPLDTLPGRCVTPPTRERLVLVNSSGVDQSGEHHSSSRDWRVHTHATFDLDGDGVQDMLVPAKKAGGCPWDIPMDVYIMRGECGHRVGTITGNLESATITAPFVAGLRELSTEATWADFDEAPSGADDPPLSESTGDEDLARRRRHFIPSHHTRERVYRFDGTILRLVSDHDRVGQCHHCGTSTCRSR